MGASDQGEDRHKLAARKRGAVRSNVTRSALIDAAENLFAEQGIESVSLRQIGVAINAGNTNVVAYHFGSKERLIEAILIKRLHELEGARSTMLKQIRDAGRERDLLALLNCLWRPVFEQTGLAGKHSYAGLLASIMRSGWGEWVRRSLTVDMVTSIDIVMCMRAALPEEVGEHFDRRLEVTSMLIIGALQHIDYTQGSVEDPATLAIFNDALQMAASAMAAPVGRAKV